MQTTTLPGGFLVPQDTHVGKWQIESGKLDHDEFTVPLACSHIPVDGTVIDCGAFDGDHTIAYSRKVGPRGLVIAFEPGELAHKCLEHNAKLFPSQTLVVHGALGDKDNEFVRHLPDENLGASRCKDGGQIPTYTLDSFLEPLALNTLDFIKIDCEGWELKVLEGGIKIIQKFRPVMLIEINQGALAEQGTSFGNICQLLSRIGYTWLIIQPEANPNSPQFDIICR